MYTKFSGMSGHEWMNDSNDSNLADAFNDAIIRFAMITSMWPPGISQVDYSPHSGHSLPGSHHLETLTVRQRLFCWNLKIHKCVLVSSIQLQCLISFYMSLKDMLGFIVDCWNIFQTFQRKYLDKWYRNWLRVGKGSLQKKRPKKLKKVAQMSSLV